MESGFEMGGSSRKETIEGRNWNFEGGKKKGNWKKAFEHGIKKIKHKKNEPLKKESELRSRSKSNGS